MGQEQTAKTPPTERQVLTPAEIGAMAHLYRAEIYRSTTWRLRLDTTTNWAVVTLGVALSISYSSPEASPLPLLLVGVLIIFFLMLEARRYRYFNVFRARARWMEKNFYAPMLREGDLYQTTEWQMVLAEDYMHPDYHVGLMTSIGRRIRRNYLWILLIQSLAYAGKIIVHPARVEAFPHALDRADVGPFPGELVIAAGIVYVVSWAGIAIWSRWSDGQRAKIHGGSSSMG